LLPNLTPLPDCVRRFSNIITQAERLKIKFGIKVFESKK
jgi:hypothetical protein